MAQLVVGLDIGTSAVRAAELDISHAQPVLLTYGQVGLPPGSLVDGEIRDGSSVTEAIKKLWENGQFSGSSVIVGIAGLRAITREIDLPFVPDSEVDSAVRFQSEEVIPFPPDQTILSSQILADYTSPEGDKIAKVRISSFGSSSCRHTRRLALSSVTTHPKKSSAFGKTSMILRVWDSTSIHQ